MFVARIAQVVFRLVQRAGERPMNVGIDQALVGASRSVRIMAEIASQQHRNGSKKMIGVLRLDGALHGLLVRGVLKRTVQADADAPHTVFQQRFYGEQPGFWLNRTRESYHIRWGNRSS